MKTQFGIVALLDVLGARNASIETARGYLRSIGRLRGTISESLDITMLSSKPKDLDTKFLTKLRPRFFGDSILMTYSVKSVSQFEEYFSRIAFILGALIAEGLDVGVLFRGAIAVGKYIESKDVALGPAVVDAANWYEKLDQIGVICTPSTTIYLKAEFTKQFGTEFNEERPTDFIVLWDAPISGGGVVTSYLIDWPVHACEVHCSLAEQSPLEWLYEKLRTFQIPLGTESKYRNTETFFKKQIAYRAAQAKEEE